MVIRERPFPEGGGAVKRPSPPEWRVWLGFILAPAVGSAVFTWTGSMGTPAGDDALLTWLMITMFGAYPTAWLIGGLAYVFLSRLLKPRLVWVVLTGVGVAAPWMIFGADNAEGLRWKESMAAAGAVGGLVFWFCVFWLDPSIRQSHGASGSRASISS
jgi:hypothetical protein